MAVSPLKKLFFLIILSFFGFNIFSQVPDQFVGIWEGKDRYILIETNGQFSIVLKIFYGWYLDRLAEPDSMAELKKRPRNAATRGGGIKINASFSKSNQNNSVWEITIFNKNKEVSTIPVAIKDKKMYLNFLQNTFKDEEKDIGLWQGVNYSEGIRIAERKNQKSIYSWYIFKSDIYRIKYWETEMEANPDVQVEFTDKENLHKIPKFITSAKKTYTCTTGKSSRIRNVEKFSSLPSFFKMEEDICATSDEYLKKIEDSGSAQKLVQILIEAESKIKPPAKLYFPTKDTDKPWSILNQLDTQDVQ